jgi:hypothetical protein
MSKMYSEEVVVELLRDSNGERGRLYYFLYKVLKERGLDYKEIMTEIVKQNTIDSLQGVEEVVGKIENPADYTKLFTSDHELNAKSFVQEILKKDEEESIILLHDCPLAHVWKTMNLDLETKKELCDLANVCDFTTASLFDCINLDIVNNCVENEYCELVIKKKK